MAADNPIQIRTCLLFSTVLAAFACGIAEGAVDWTGGTEPCRWLESADNWSGGAFPTADDSVRLGPGKTAASVTVEAGDAAAAKTLYFGDGTPYVGASGAGGSLTVEGGSLTASGITMHCSGDAVVRLMSGTVGLGTGSLHFWGGRTNALIQSGGAFSGVLSFQGGTSADSLVEITGGSNAASSWSFGTSSGSTAGKMHLRIVGSAADVRVGKGSFHTPYSEAAYTAPTVFAEFTVGPDAERRDAFAVSPVYVTTPRYSGGYASIRGVHHLRPAGGVQLMTRDFIPLYVKGHDGWIVNHGYEQVESDDSQHGFTRSRFYSLVGAGLWQDSFRVVYTNAVLGTSGATWQFGLKRGEEGGLSDGATALDEPLVRGFFRLPKLARETLDRLTRASVRLRLEPTGGETLETLVAGFRANGYEGSAVEECGIYNVRLDIPVWRLTANAETDWLLFDFAEYPTYAAAAAGASAVRARVAAAKWDPVVAAKPYRGTMVNGNVSEADLDELARLGATLIRFQIVRNGAWKTAFPDGDGLEAYYAWLDGRLDHLAQTVRRCRDRGIRVCIDLHYAPGGFNEATYSTMMMYLDQRYADAFVETWRRIAARFRRDRDVVYGYDLINEPIDRKVKGAVTTWRALMARTIETVRAIDPETPIVVEPNCNASPEGFAEKNIYGLDDFEPLPYDNLVYSVHVYQPMDFTHQGIGVAADKYEPIPYPNPERGWNIDFLRGQIRNVRSVELKYGVKIYVGEFSAAVYAPGADDYIRDLCRLFTEYGWDVTYHAFREATCWSPEHVGTNYYDIRSSPKETRRTKILRKFFADAGWGLVVYLRGL